MSDQTPPPAAIVQRIRKLLALANDGRGNENEMAVAATKAAELMAEWSLEAAQLAADSGRAEDVVRTRAGGERSAAWPWQVNLMRTVSELNFCVHWVDTVRSARRPGAPVRSRPRHFLLGRAECVAAAQFTYDFLVTTLDALYPEDEFGPRLGLSAKSWFNGATMRVCARLVQDRRDDELRRAARASGDGRSLVTISSYAEEERWANNDALYGHAPGTTRTRVLASRAAARLATERYSRELAERPPAPPVESKETPAQRAKREAREARESERYWSAHQRRQERADAKVDHRALEAGRQTGDRVALRPEVK